MYKDPVKEHEQEDCGKRVSKKTNPIHIQTLKPMSVKEMRAIAKRYMPYLHMTDMNTRQALCTLLRPYMTSINDMYKNAMNNKELKVRRFPMYDGRNSCYLDSLLVALFASYATPWIIKRFLTTSQPSGEPVLKALRMLYTQMRVPGHCMLAQPLRIALRQYYREHPDRMRGIEWTYSQNDPNDVLHALIQILNIKEDIWVTEHTPTTSRKKRVMFNTFMLDQGLLHLAAKERRVVFVRDLFPEFVMSEKTKMVIEKIGGGLYIPILRNWMDESKLKTLVVAPASIMDATLKAILVHNGSSPVSGHYTTVLRSKNQWVLYDDMKGGVSQVIGRTMEDLWRWNDKYICKNMAGLLYLRPVV